MAGENIPKHCQLIVLGFSQGVSIATRWVAHSGIKCAKLVLYAGAIPNELRASDFSFLSQQGTQVSVIIGDHDEYLTKKRREAEAIKIKNLFAGKAKLISFDGKHEIKPALIRNLVE